MPARSEQHPQSPLGSEAASKIISDEVVRIHRESYGSGAKTVKTYVHDDLVLSVLDVELLPAEVVVIDQGRSDLVLEMRSSFQLELETSFTAAVERATGRKVIAFLSDTHLDPPFVTELFRLGARHDVDIADDIDGNRLCRRYAAEPEAPPAARRALGVFADRLDFRQLEVLQLLVTELMTNAVRHGSGGASGTVELDVTVSDDTVTAQVSDDGEGFVRGSRGPGPSGGWGLVLVESLATRWGIERNPTRVWVEIARAPR
jgi:serine/threonine-protein kinase RsbW